MAEADEMVPARETPHAHQHAPGVHHHGPPKGFIRKYVFSIDHKVIGIQYLLLALSAVVVGLVMSVLMRMNLSWPGHKWPLLGTLFSAGAPGGVMTPEFYLSLVTMHGTIMVFFVLTTAPQGGFGNYFLPIQVGAEDMAFPVLNMLSFWVTFVGFVVILAAIFVGGNEGSDFGLKWDFPVLGSTGGWTGYPTLSAVGHQLNVPGMGMGMNLWIISIAIFCVASLLGALNFIVTLLNLRTRGMTLMRMPLTCWAWFTTAILALLSFPVLLGAGVLLLLDRVAGTSFFVPGGVSDGTRLLDHAGGSPILWQHLFWFFGHPEVYIAILPGMGATSHILSTFARKPIFGYRAMVFAMFAIGLLGFFVWGHHMFVSGMSPYSGMTFSILTLSIGVPSAVKTFNWLGTLWGARIRFTTPMLYAIGFVSLFVAGGITGLVLGQSTLDLGMHDTYFVLGHFHLVMGVAAIFGMFAATAFWFPKMFGRMMSERLGQIHFWVTFAGVYGIFIPFHIMGISGMPRRFFSFSEYAFLQSQTPLVQLATWSAIVTALVQVVFFFNFFYSIFRGEKVSNDNPWEATTLEWVTPTPPPHDNFGGKIPTVYRGAYEFAVPGARDDYVVQWEPPEADAEGGENAQGEVRVSGNGGNGHKH
ncbi:MAG TPA: cbb3-type cytochrome c oxidase subunit I [Pyrinomonadaceae bacterium]|nr:cbb3-type cytochrome c oxidase subunit I [Pyrinomonadaceae bacterium]